MKVNTDGVLLGAWTALAGARSILDVGAGTGVIALMLAQRAPQAFIDGVEIDAATARQAAENVAASPWPDRVQIITADFQSYAAGAGKQYDLIVSNPPYFVDALLPGDLQRMQARHATALPYDDLLDGAGLCLAPEGMLSLILPYVEASVFIAKAAVKGFYCVRKTNVCTAPGKAVKRQLLSFTRTPAPLQEQMLYIHTKAMDREAVSDYSFEYKQLTAAFYLNF